MSDTPAISMDVFATVLNAFEVKLDDKIVRDGADLAPLLRGETNDPPHASLCWRVGKKAALRQGDWKLVREKGGWQLFDLANDIGEAQDLAASEPARLKAMTAAWEAWNREQMNALW